jgi:hypothetical protein
LPRKLPRAMFLRRSRANRYAAQVQAWLPNRSMLGDSSSLAVLRT